MLNRDRENQLTFFGRNFKRSHLNWGNTAFFLLVASMFGKELTEHGHKPADDLDTFSEKFFLSLTLLSLLLYILINKKQIGKAFRSIQACLTCDEPITPPLERLVIVPVPAEEKFISKTLSACLARSRRISTKIDITNNSNVTEACPKEFECPISQLIMKCPVVASDGVTYDYDSIYRVINSTKKSPITREEIASLLNPQPILQDKIETWLNLQIERCNKLNNQNLSANSNIKKMVQ